MSDADFLAVCWGKFVTELKKVFWDLPSGCIVSGVNDLTKSSGVMKITLVSASCSVAKYLKTLSGVLYALILFSYSMIYKKKFPRSNLKKKHQIFSVS